MELKTQVVYVAALLACSLIASSEPITCYVCDSQSARGCSDPFRPKSYGIKTCIGYLSAACTKTKTFIGGQFRVNRGCEWPLLSPENVCRHESDSEGKVTCTCTSNLCNNAKSIIRSAWLLAVVSVLSMSAAILN